MRRRRSLWLSATAVLALNAMAQSLSLDVSGAISRYTDTRARVYRVSEPVLRMLPQYTIVTATSWTPRSAFVGPRIVDILQLVGANGKEVEFQTLNNYVYSISIEEARRYGVILAHTQNGKRLTPSDFGPLFVVYPRDQYPNELKTPITEAKYVWQVIGMRVK